MEYENTYMEMRGSRYPILSVVNETFLPFLMVLILMTLMLLMTLLTLMSLMIGRVAT